jgi:TRAP-type mannitol/chloroaromatic compound transport system permease small subunit
MEKIFRAIDKINESASNAACLLFAPLAVFSTYEVFMRYVLNRPTTWVWDVNVHLFALIVVFGAGNTLLKGGHVIMDVMITHLPRRTRLILNLIAYVFFIFAVGIMVWQSAVFAWRSVQVGEKTSTLLAMAVYPFKICIFCGIALLWLEGVTLFIRDIHALTSGRRPGNG